MAMEDSKSITSRVASLLRQTSAAHGEYEEHELKGIRDEQWPAWYAEYLRKNGLPQLLAGMPGRDRVISGLDLMLAEADGSYSNAETQTGEWPEYYARYLLRLAATGSEV